MCATPSWADVAPAPAPEPDPIAARIEALEAKVAANAARISELEAAQELADSAASPTDTEPTFQLHGFMDMGLQKTWATDPSDFSTTATTFVLGNVNLYFGFHPAEHWTAFTEVRLTAYSDGAATRVQDPASGIGDDTTALSDIVLERAYLEWRHSEVLSVRAGEFLTPFGIWNVDHGSPTVIPIVRPEAITQELFPKHQLGVEVYGEKADLLPGRWTLEYHGYVSNGRTQTGVDPTEDKMLGGRLVAATTRPHRMAFGVSAMVARNSDLTAGRETSAYREHGLAADASLDLGSLRLRSEVTYRKVEQQIAASAMIATGDLTPDVRQLDAYALAAYRIPKTRFEPYLFTEAYRVPDDQGNLQLIGSGGLNIYFTPAVQLKFQFLHTRFYQVDDAQLHRGQETENYLGARFVMGL